jgi:uncharacterized protein (TIGR02300 family)
MAKAELGDKQVCPSCGAKFYDLRKRPAVCPKCATAFDPADETVKLKRTRRAPAYGRTYEDDEEAAPEAAVADEEEEEVEVTPELDASAVDEVVVVEDDEEAAVEGELPPGFSEDEGDLEDETTGDDEVPMLEDEEEFNEDEIGDLPGGDEEV